MFKKFNKRAIVVIVAVVSVIAIVGGSLAWFVSSSSLSQKLSISGFNVAADIYFKDGDEKTSASKYRDSDGLYLLSLDKEAVNYIGKLRVDVGHSGARSCVRVKMSHEWMLPDNTVTDNVVSVPYKFNSQWYDNRESDYCIYYRGADNSGKADFESCPLIVGFDDVQFGKNGLNSDAKVKLMIQVDAVQVNRYPQMWNIDKLPWK